MTSAPGLPPLDGCDDPASVVAFAREQQRAEDAAAARLLQSAARWASMHSTDSLVGPADAWHESALPLGGEGCPEVAEFAITEFAAAIGRSPESGRIYLACAVEAAYRLPRTWKALGTGRITAWRVQMIAKATMCLSPAAAGFVDAHVAAVAGKVGPAQLMRLVEEAKSRFDPERVEAERRAAAETRHVDIDLRGVGLTGTAHLDADLDLADALDLETAVADVAHQLLVTGCTEALDVRRSMALGLLARGQHGLDFDTTREVVLHAHIDADALGPDADDSTHLARVERVGTPITAEQVRTWCGNPYSRVTVRPVIDLGEHIWVGSYEASARLREQTELRDGCCVHPWCTRPATRCDHDHRVPHAPEHPGTDNPGPTCSCNQAPLCRRHHRSKTTGGWRYVTVEPGIYLWRSPLGYHYLRDHTGTLDVTPDEDRRRYARELTAHFGDQQPPDE